MKVVCANLGEDLGYETYNEAITIGKTYYVHSQWQTYDLIRLKDGRATVENVILYLITNEGKSVISFNRTNILILYTILREPGRLV